MRAGSEQLLGRIADRLKAMADPMRLRILHVLQDGERCVNDILGQVGGSQANVSKHLSVLRRAGLVECRREGVNVYYRIEDPTVFAICETVLRFFGAPGQRREAGDRAGTGGDERGGPMSGWGDILLPLGVLAAWLILQWVVLPKLGVPT